ncbi:thioredoxin family protein [Salsuginibacillus kocurii]|uniref:thioredoxin family protein n=1 Tax=Salsuginibacillus kocurii TaxID=427078 RepID=UPI0003AABC98|nr:thioredoxin family protein [Salsuginibacillus kocurii]
MKWQLAEWANNWPQLPIYSADREQVASFAGQHLLFAAPTLLLFMEGKEVWRGSRFIDWDELNRVVHLFKTY